MCHYFCLYCTDYRRVGECKGRLIRAKRGQPLLILLDTQFSLADMPKEFKEEGFGIKYPGFYALVHYTGGDVRRINWDAFVIKPIVQVQTLYTQDKNVEYWFDKKVLGVASASRVQRNITAMRQGTPASKRPRGAGWDMFYSGMAGGDDVLARAYKRYHFSGDPALKYHIERLEREQRLKRQRIDREAEEREAERIRMEIKKVVRAHAYDHAVAAWNAMQRDPTYRNKAEFFSWLEKAIKYQNIWPTKDVALMHLRFLNAERRRHSDMESKEKAQFKVECYEDMYEQQFGEDWLLDPSLQ